MAEVVSFINMKGGVGKTTMAVNVGYTLSKEFGKKVLLIDADPQMNATQYVFNERQVEEIYEDPRKTLYSILSSENDFPSVASRRREPITEPVVIFNIDTNFDFIPSHLKIMNLNLEAHSNLLKIYIKENELKRKYDVILLDLPPTISSYTKISLLASDRYLVPMKTDFLSLVGLPLLENYIERLEREYEIHLEFLGIILTMVRPDFSIYKQIKEKILKKEAWKRKLFEYELKYTTDVEKSLIKKEEKLPYIIELNNSELTAQIINITQEFMQRMRL